jgi:universal stress protein A
MYNDIRGRTMSHYTHILVGLDLSEKESGTVMSKAKDLAKLYQAKLSIVHVVEPLAFTYPGEIPVDLGTTQIIITEHAEKHLEKFAQQVNYPLAHAQVLIGQTAPEIRQMAQDIGADLIVLGTHGRHGLGLLLGSTASDLLHGTKCDVLAVRI